MSDIVFSEERHIGLITLNRPQALNALTLPMIMLLQKQLDSWRMNDDIHAVVLQAAPGNAFCAGGDVRWLYENRERHAEQMLFFWHEYRLNYCIHTYPKPYIALMDGATMGGGVGIALHGSHPVASERFLFAMPETSIGFFPDIGASYLLSRCASSHGRYLGLTGQRIGAADALALGLINQVIDSDDFPKVITALIETDLSDSAHTQVSDCIAHFARPPAPSALKALSTTVNHCFKHTDMAQIGAALCGVDDEWHNETWQVISKKSPLSLQVTLMQLNKASGMSIAECLITDYCLASHFMRGLDFYEGVRALLVDKDKTPRWQPRDMADVSQTMTLSYFEADVSARLDL